MDTLLDEIWKARHPKDALFISIIEGYTIKESNEFPNEIFYMKSDSLLIDYDLKIKCAWINCELIWSVFSSKFSLNYQETRELLRAILETHLKLEGTTSIFSGIPNESRLEIHLELKGTTL